jgi:hypothetical protein
VQIVVKVAKFHFDQQVTNQFSVTIVLEENEMVVTEVDETILEVENLDESSMTDHHNLLQNLQQIQVVSKNK